jgi:thioredoxin 1
MHVVLLLQFNQPKYAVAQVETMEAIVGTIKYTPTFAIYRNGRKVDEVVGKEPERLADHLWLHSD